ncbi:hypothetical protein LWI29_026614 [Acer saccharum]|uniref:Uncharacterized protein n=1 Tax=Acer saccharum TaxID=4024 RepID=A0AA39REI7_ACESA|nr:hypothetical protein LWI29_026614 [Acer saccharum]
MSSVSLPLGILNDASKSLNPSTIPCVAPLAHSPNASGTIPSSTHLPIDSLGVTLPATIVLPTMPGSNHPMMTRSKTGTTAQKHYSLAPRRHVSHAIAAPITGEVRDNAGERASCLSRHLVILQ